MSNQPLARDVLARQLLAAKAGEKLAGKTAANPPLPIENEASAQPNVVIESDYQAFCAALSESARGRAFLTEYARRNRHADTGMLLAALDRLEAQMHRHAAAPEADRIRQELRALLAAIQTTRPEIDDSPNAIRAAKFAALLGFIEHRIDVIAAASREESILPEEVAALVMPDRAAEAARSALAVVPMPEQPELPMPTPLLTQPPMEIVRAPAPQALAAAAPAPAEIRRAASVIPEVTFAFGSAPAQKTAGEVAAIDAAVAELNAPMPVTIGEPETAAALPAADPLAAIMALSEAERIALFT
ncbi:MAG: hypothetical protein WDN48_11205 [Pseudolabrys sp.]